MKYLKHSFAVIIGVVILLVSFDYFIVLGQLKTSSPTTYRSFSSQISLSTTSRSVAPQVITFAITCGTEETDAVEEMQPLLKSILALTSAPVRFLFITDRKGLLKLNELFTKRLGYSKRAVYVDIYLLENKAIDAFAYKIKMDSKNHHSGRFGTAKLMIPWLFPGHRRAIVLDTDMVMLDDPVRLWNEFEDGNPNWVYKFPSTNRQAWNHMCSGVTLIDLERARTLKLYPNPMRKALASVPGWYNKKRGLYYPNGDQGLYWLMMRISPHLFAKLPDRWMRDKCHNYSGALNPTGMKKVRMLHRNCFGTNSNTLRDLSSPFFDFFLHYSWHWLQPEGNETREKVKMGYGERVKYAIGFWLFSSSVEVWE